MRFGPVDVASAIGAILAHSQTARKMPYDQGATYRIAKGTCLTGQHVQDLAQEGLLKVVVAQLDAEDVDENTAALRLAEAVVGEDNGQIRATDAGAGRVNLYASQCGLVQVSADIVNRINAIDPMVTIATVPDLHRVDVDGMIATIKIISYAVPDVALRMACDVAAGAIKIRVPVFATATLIETVVGTQSSPDKGRRSMAGRVERMGMQLTERKLVAHEITPLAKEISQATGDVVLILTGSATSDPEDVAPQALRQAGGAVTRFGMPVDPGNLLFLGRVQNKPVIGLPGCARSPALNGADWVLERVICGLDVTADDISGMGVGGLLKEIPTRPMPREKGV